MMNNRALVGSKAGSGRESLSVLCKVVKFILSIRIDKIYNTDKTSLGEEREDSINQGAAT